jgi:hypothetical protein
MSYGGDFMNEIIKTAALSSLCTGLLGFVAFLLSQVYFKSIERYKDLKARTVHALVFYADTYLNPIDLADIPDRKLPERYEQASLELRKLAADWSAYIELKARPGIFVAKNDVLETISANLIGLSNSMHVPFNSKDSKTSEYNELRANKIKELLKIYKQK